MITALVLSVFIVTGYAQTAINLTGTVVDSTTSEGISNALVKIVEVAQCSTRTNSSGAFTLTGTAVKTIASPRSITSGEIVVDGNKVSLSGLPAATNVAMAMYSIDGKRMFFAEDITNGKSTIQSGDFHRAGRIYLVSVKAFGKEYHAMSNGMNKISIPIMRAESDRLAKTAATYTVQVVANGYNTRNVTSTISTGTIGTIKLSKCTAQIGVWTNVTPSDFSTDPNFAGSGQNFGATVLLANPAKPGTVYAFACYQGCWRSTDYGATWVNFNAGNGFYGTNPDGVDIARNVGGAIAQDGSYMVITSIYPATPPNAVPPNDFYPDGGKWITSLYISRENGGDSALGKYWEKHDMPEIKPYRAAIDPSDKNHVIVTMGTNDLFESFDAGRTWNNTGAVMPAITMEIFFLNSNTLIAGAADDGGSYRGVKVGSTYPWTWIFTKISDQSQAHTMWHFYIDTVGKHLYFPGINGVDKSSDLDGSSWTNLCNGSTCVTRTLVATPKRFYIGDEGPVLGWHAARLKYADRSNETTWIDQPQPTDMTNGPVYCRVLFDGQHYILVSCNWLGGMWRYIEP
jgi:hypothetical protein